MIVGRKRAWRGWKGAPICFLAPAVVLFLLLFAIPAISSLYVSLCKWTGFTPRMEFTGLNNFIKLCGDERFRHAIINNLWIVSVGGLVFFFFACLFAAALNSSNLRARKFFQTMIFFPAFTAGPIDRAERHLGDDMALPDMAGLAAPRYVEGGTRIMVGIFKKFVVADSLAIFALNPTLAAQTDSALWTWVMLYGYAFRLFLDFSGYTDIAIGIGRLLGISLPENFDRPYLKPNLTAFWNSWHITLAQWFRAYFFNPLTRALRSRPRTPPIWAVILLGQFSTMALIGLWHGITWNFFIWGAWHGLGLFIHNRWSDWTRVRITGWAVTKPRQILLNLSGVLLTFHFVALGWVSFALATPEMSWRVIVTLFGVSG